MRHGLRFHESCRELVAADARTLEIAALAVRVAASEATVMITGPSGSGKEVFARHIHRHSTRAQGPFVAINCAAIPEHMLEAMLFGNVYAPRDAERMVDAFGARLREEVELTMLRSDLLATVDGALRPASASVWLKAADVGRRVG